MIYTTEREGVLKSTLDIINNQSNQNHINQTIPHVIDKVNTYPATIHPSLPQPPKTVTQESLRLTDDFEPNELSWVIEDLIDKNRLHMIAGPTCSGKTRIMLRMISDWSSGLNIFNHKSNPSTFVYIDMGRDKMATKTALRSVGIDPSSFFVINYKQEACDFNTLINTRIPKETEIIFIDDISNALGYDNHPDPSSSATNVYRFLSKLQTYCTLNNKTIIFTHGFIKSEQGTKYTSPKSKIYGAQTWLKLCETIIFIDEENPSDLYDPYRLIDIISHNYLVKLPQRRYKLDDKARLIPCAQLDPLHIENDMKENQESSILDKMSKGVEYTIPQLLNGGDIPRSTLYKIINKLTSRGVLGRKGNKYYLP